MLVVHQELAYLALSVVEVVERLEKRKSKTKVFLYSEIVGDLL